MPDRLHVNRLINEDSPYLRQHAHQPVDWWPWSEEAFREAVRRNVAIMLSSGYSACHWCHVMARESFADEETARIINEHFVPVKVDREERPDIDQVYQEALQALGGQGGWPLTVFLTPDGKPFWGGTYFPPEPAYNRPGFRQVLRALARAWAESPDDLRASARELSEMLGEKTPPRPEEREEPLTEEMVRGAAAWMRRRMDQLYGGFGGAPKFPNPGAILFLLAHGHLRHDEDTVGLALHTLRRMARGGIHDQLGGGFHRYSTDEQWLVPHFEKMLYDNAQLLEAYTAAWQIAGEACFAAVARGIIAYVRREMTAGDGGFFAAQDADTEGEEGRYYLWSDREVRALLPEEERRVAALAYGLSAAGNFAGRNVLYRSLEPADIAAALERSVPSVERDLVRARRILLASRETRPRPFRDEKILLGWNGLMISGLARAHQALADRRALEMARRAADFLLRAMPAGPGRLFHVYQAGRAKVPGFLDDYAFFTRALFDLYESDFDPRWLAPALRFLATALEDFREEDGRYRLTGHLDDPLFIPPLSGSEQAIPSGVAVHCQNLIRAGHLTGVDRYAREAESILRAYVPQALAYPLGYSAMLTALEMQLHGPTVVAVVGLDDRGLALLRKIRRTYIPYRVLAAVEAGRSLAEHPAASLFLERPAKDGAPTAYICARGRCHPPKTDWPEIAPLLEEGSAVR